MKVNIVSPNYTDLKKITKPLTYQREGSDATKLVCVPLGLTGVETSLFPCRVAYKRGTSEVKNGRRRILVEDTIPVYLNYEVGSSAELPGAPVEASRANIKIHTVLELPWTTPVIAGTVPSGLSVGTIIRNQALAALLKIHAMNFIPNLGTTLTGTVNSLGDGTGAFAADGTEDEYLNSPFVRGSFGIEPYGDSVELGAADTVVE